jgi:hypothetical protein
MFGRRISALALLLSCASAPLQASVDPLLNADCWQDSEVEALKVQRFKTMLLVSMLNCRDIEPGIAADYNRFVRANRDLIARKQAVVRQHFIRTYGPSAGLTAYSAFETSLGNRYSDADFDYRRCAAVAQDARLAGYVSEAGLMDIVESMPEEDRLAICRPEPLLAARPAEWAPPPPQRVAEAPVEVAQNEWPDLAPVEPEGPATAMDPNQVLVAEAAPPPPAPMPEKVAEPAPVQVAAVDVKPPVPAIDRVQAVRDAARALREALAALEDAEPTAPLQ